MGHFFVYSQESFHLIIPVKIIPGEKSANNIKFMGSVPQGAYVGESVSCLGQRCHGNGNEYLDKAFLLFF